MAGFQALRNQSDTDYQGKLETYAVLATHTTLLAPGDVVVITGTGDTSGRAAVDTGAQGAAITGVIASVFPQFEGENLTQTGLPALTAGEVHCHIAPNMDFEVEVSNGNPLAVTDIGSNADAVFTTATQTGGITFSNMTLDAGTVATTSTLQFRIVALKEDSDGVLGNIAVVRFNNTTLNDGTTGV